MTIMGKTWDETGETGGGLREVPLPAEYYHAEPAPSGDVLKAAPVHPPSASKRTSLLKGQVPLEEQGEVFLSVLQECRQMDEQLLGKIRVKPRLLTDSCAIN